MPLARRLAAELRPEWKNHCIRYKELQRRAEALVGETNEEEEYVFRNHLECAVERTNDFFLIKARPLIHRTPKPENGRLRTVLLLMVSVARS
ncbi:hypothetical protein T484DRAFT_1795248 [Baffinella frigidus]|nr:hypothetical protein T484DRAFT_1795248 [Cryptophyta sp. CCMP2293]